MEHDQDRADGRPTDWHETGAASAAATAMPSGLPSLQSADVGADVGVRPGAGAVDPALAAADAASAGADSPVAGADSALAGADLGRRKFFRAFATEMVQTAATVVGAATAIQRTSIEAASGILAGPRADSDRWADAFAELTAVATTGVDSGATRAGAPGIPGLAPVSALPSTSTFGRPLPAVGYHSAFRVADERIVIVNQRRLPFAIVEIDCRTAIDVAVAIGDRAVVGGPAVGQVAALGLAFSANRIRASRPYARRAILRAAETTLLAARPTSTYLRFAVERVMNTYRAIGELDEDGDRIADAMQHEADAIVFEASDDHGRLAEAGATRIPRRANRPAGVLTVGATGAMAGGQFGTALGAVQAATYAGRDVHVHVLEGRPALDGARVTIWELAQAGIPHTLVPDAAAGSLLQSGVVDVVLVGAESVAANGDVANDTGTYPVAAIASRHGVPVIVCAPLAAVDLSAADGRALVTAERPAVEGTEVGRVPVTLPGTPALNPAIDVTPAGLVTAWATEEGLLEGSFGKAFAAAKERRIQRLPASLAWTKVLDETAVAADPPSATAAPSATVAAGQTADPRATPPLGSDA